MKKISCLFIVAAALAISGCTSPRGGSVDAYDVEISPAERSYPGDGISPAQRVDPAGSVVYPRTFNAPPPL